MFFLNFALALLAIIPIVVLVRWVTWRDRYTHLTQQLADLTTRTEYLEAAVKQRFSRLTQQVADLTARTQELEQQTGLAQAASPPPQRVVEKPPEPAAPSPAPELQDAEAWIALHAKTPAAADSEPAGQVTEAPVEPPDPTPEARPRKRLFAPLTESGADAADWETLIGGNWLNKIGIVVLVTGMALFLGYSLRHMGPLGRVGTGLVTSLILLLGGAALERVEKYTLFAKPLIGGGWALLYFTTYAAHNIEAAKVIQEPIWGLVLLGLVAVGMILHSFRYRSQVVTGLAYFLGFLTVAISPLTGFTLIASFILAASLVAILRTTQWYPIGLFGVVATYLNHLLWLEHRIGGSTHLAAAGSFWLSQGMLVIYWLLFVALDFILQPVNDQEEHTGVAINLTNTLAFFGLSLWQVWAVFPEYGYLLTGCIGAAYIVTSYLLRKIGRQKLYLINASVAIVLIALTFALKPPTSPLSKNWLAIAWLVEAVAVLALGSHLKEIVFRAQAYILSLCALGALFFINLYGTPEPPHLLRWMTVLPAAAYFHILLWWLPKSIRAGKFFDEERNVGQAFSYAGSALLVVLLWKELNPVAVALAWALLGLILIEVGVRFQQTPFRIQGHLLSALAFGRLFMANFTAPDAILGVSHRIVSVLPIIAIFYYLVHRMREGRDAGSNVEREQYPSRIYSYAAAVLLIVLARFEFGRSLTVLAWATTGLVFLTIGLLWRDRDLRVQSCLIAILTVWRSWSTNFFLVGSLFGIPERIATTVPVIAFLYASKLLCLYRHKAFPEPEAGQRMRALMWLDTNSRHLFSILASLLLAILLYYGVQGNLLTVAWTIQGLGLMAAGFLIRERTFRLSGLGLFALCLLKVFLIDLSGLEMIYRIFSFIVLGAILLLVSFGYTKYKDVIKRYI